MKNTAIKQINTINIFITLLYQHSVKSGNRDLNRFIRSIFFHTSKSTYISKLNLHAIVDTCRVAEPLNQTDGMRAASICKDVAYELGRCVITHSADIILLEYGFVFIIAWSFSFGLAHQPSEKMT